jgi:hypothetical protein
MPGLHGLVWVGEFSHLNSVCMNARGPDCGTKLKRVKLNGQIGISKEELGETAARAVYQGGGSDGLFNIQYELPQKPLRWYIAVWMSV